MKKTICVKIDPNLLEELDDVVAKKPSWIKRNTAIEHAIRSYVNAFRLLPFEALTE